MCLCWNDDGSMCDPKELARRIDLHLKGLYKPWLSRRDMMQRERADRDAAVAAMTEEERAEIFNLYKRAVGLD
jgi:hypothetical protein